MVPHQFWCKQGQLPTKAKSAINLGNGPLKSTNFLWNQGLMLLLRSKDGAAWVGNSIASIAPWSQVCVSPCFLTLPSPSPLQKPPVLPGGNSCYCRRCLEDRRGLLEWQARIATLSLVEICWCESSLQWYQTACHCNPSNNWLGKFLFQTI